LDDTVDTVTTIGASPTANIILNNDLSSPTSIVMDSSGKFYVSDSDNNQILKLDSDGDVLATYGSEGDGVAEFHTPRGLAIDNNGYIWVADMNNDRIVRFNPASQTTFENSFWTFGTTGETTTTFTTPVDLVIQYVDAHVKVCVVDLDNERIQIIPVTLSTSSCVVDTENIESWTFDDNDDYGKAVSIALDDDDNFFVARKLGVVEKYEPALGSPKKRYGTGSTIISQDPGDIYIDDDKLYSADHGNDEVHVYNAVGGSFVATYGTSGSSLGQFNNPKALVAQNGQVYVVEETNNRLQTFKEE